MTTWHKLTTEPDIFSEGYLPSMPPFHHQEFQQKYFRHFDKEKWDLRALLSLFKMLHVLQMRCLASFLGPNHPQQCQRSLNSAHPRMCHSYGEKKKACWQCAVIPRNLCFPAISSLHQHWPGSYIFLPRAWCAGRHQPAAAPRSSINSSSGSLCRCPKSSQRLKVRINKIDGWNC